MRHLACGLLVLAVMAVGVGASQEARTGGKLAEDLAPRERIDSLRWLEGSWRGRLGESDYVTSYTGPEGGVILGASKEIRDGETRVFDFERIHVEEGRVLLTPYPFGRASRDSFPLVEHDPKVRRAVFENRRHDFPKRFTYEETTPDHLTIVLEGDPDTPLVRIELTRR